ncbi:ribosome recycling factor [Desulforegula conservatrix]|uniref:ribosome recycling factor n=1 Tax=Desulforegula conservatrix TaxID=153026 RepID=UPI00041F9F9A|nr:ribosome recycling factor [Desulforegula conservatrix]
MINSIQKEAQDKMSKTTAVLKADLQKVRTGRASLSLLDPVKVDYYGTPTPLSQIASLAIPESRMITIQPWDASIIKEIEKAILKANIGLTPSSDGKMVRVSIPPLTEQRRKEIVKTVQKISEEHKVSVRNIRRDANEVLKGLKKDGKISEDDMFKAQDYIQKITDEHVKQIDEINREKEKEILEF